MHSAQPVALTIAGSDPSGGAGIQADLKTFHQFGVYGEAVITLVTAQNTVAFERVEYLKADLVAAQIRSVIADIPPDAAKTGALGNREIIEAVADLAPGFRFPLIVDPVMASKHGGALLSPDAIACAENATPATRVSSDAESGGSGAAGWQRSPRHPRHESRRGSVASHGPACCAGEGRTFERERRSMFCFTTADSLSFPANASSPDTRMEPGARFRRRSPRY